VGYACHGIGHSHHQIGGSRGISRERHRPCRRIQGLPLHSDPTLPLKQVHHRLHSLLTTISRAFHRLQSLLPPLDLTALSWLCCYLLPPDLAYHHTQSLVFNLSATFVVHCRVVSLTASAQGNEYRSPGHRRKFSSCAYSLLRVDTLSDSTNRYLLCSSARTGVKQGTGRLVGPAVRSCGEEQYQQHQQQQQRRQSLRGKAGESRAAHLYNIRLVFY
jgi:hypothetical protein